MELGAALAAEMKKTCFQVDEWCSNQENLLVQMEDSHTGAMAAAKGTISLLILLQNSSLQLTTEEIQSLRSKEENLKIKLAATSQGKKNLYANKYI